MKYEQSTTEKLDGNVNRPVNEGVNGVGQGAMVTFSLIQKTPGINTPQLVTISGKSKATIECHIAELKKNNMIEHRGSAKTGGYYAKKKE